MLELFLMVTTIPDMLPHDGDHCGKGLSDIGAVSDGLHSPLYLTCSLMMVTTVVRASMMLVLFLIVSARSLSTSSATAFLSGTLDPPLGKRRERSTDQKMIFITIIIH